MIYEVGLNTYMTIEEADQIVADEYDLDSEEATLWNSFSLLQKQRTVLNGTKKISAMIWRGIQYPGFQPLQWPRLIDCRYLDCPHDVKIAIIKQALTDKIYNTKQEASLVSSGIKSYQIKGASITFSENASKANRLNNGIWDDVYTDYLEKWTV